MFVIGNAVALVENNTSLLHVIFLNIPRYTFSMLQLGMLLGALALPVLVKDGIQKNRRQIDLLISVYGQSHDAIVFADPKWPLKLL